MTQLRGHGAAPSPPLHGTRIEREFEPRARHLFSGTACRLLEMSVLALLLGGCGSLPPGADYPRRASTAFDSPATTRFGRHFATAVHAHPGQSGFYILSAGEDGFLIRMQIIQAAQRTLDLQYFAFHADQTGKLLANAILHAADRGVRVRLLLDDGERFGGDNQIATLVAHPHIQIRYYNPFRYRGTAKFFRGLEFLVNSNRLDYRMHNKLFVADNAIALVGGRNIGDMYFQIDPDGQYADDDVFTAGPIVQQLSGSFDRFWNNPLSIPQQALEAGPTAEVTGQADQPTEDRTEASATKPSERERARIALARHRETLDAHREVLKDEGVDYVKRIASGEPLNGIISGRLPLVWARAKLVYDSPDKKDLERGSMVGKLMFPEVFDQASKTQHELLMITPYLVPGEEGMQLFRILHERNVHVRILTTSLESSTVLPAQAGYMHYRIPLLHEGVELYETRALLGSTRGSGEKRVIADAGNFSLHAKLLVFDEKSVFIGSMNFDQRSMHLNTEIGLIIDSPELAHQVAVRFNAMTRPENAYRVSLASDSRHLVWRTCIAGKMVDYAAEPARSPCQRFRARALSQLPLDGEL